MKLIELEPHFIRYETKNEVRQFIVGDADTWRDRGCPTEKRLVDCEYKIYVDQLHTINEKENAQGIMFLCPKCFGKNNSKIGVHQVEVTFKDKNVTNNQGTQNREGPVRWEVLGTYYNDLSTTPSILVIGGCGAHFYITNGEITN